MSSETKRQDANPSVEERTAAAQQEFHDLIRQSPPWYKSLRQIQLNLLLISPLLVSTSWGFDLSMTNGLQSVDIFMNNFGNPHGSSLGFYGASTAVGGLVACLIGGYITDRLGRRFMVFLGEIFVIVAALIQTFSTSFGMFLGGKVIIGLGASFAQLGGPVLVTELAHPRTRVFISSFYNTNIFLGLIIGGWITFGTYRIPSEWSWKIPCLLQVVLPTYQVLMIWFCPESPRWLVSKGKYEEAKRILMRYHSSVPDQEDSIVRLELEEIVAGIEADKTQTKFNWDGLKSILATPGNRHRLWICLWVAMGSQCGGGTMISSYLPEIMDQIGMPSSKDKTLMNGIMSICNYVFTFIALFLISRFKRRTVFLTSTIGLTAVFIVWTALTKKYLDTREDVFGKAVLAMMFCFNFFQAPCWIPLVIAYPVETLTTKQRGVMFGLHMFFINIGGFLSQYIVPVGIDNLSWRYYIIQIVFNGCLIVIIYFTFVETQGRTLEEIAVVFDGEQDFNLAQATASEVLKTGDAVHLEKLSYSHVQSA